MTNRYNQKRFYDRKEPTFDFEKLSENIEGPLQRGHKAIGSSAQIIEIGQPRKPLITLDRNTQDWVNTDDEASGVFDFTGNVTRFNTVSRNGRAYIDQIGHIVPFRPSKNFLKTNDQILSWSLHGNATGEHDHLLSFKAKKILTASKKVKRTILLDCQPKN